MTWVCGAEVNWEEETEGARRYVPVADTMEAEEEAWREICREMVPNWDMGTGPRPGPCGTADAEGTGGWDRGKEKERKSVKQSSKNKQTKQTETNNESIHNGVLSVRVSGVSKPCRAGLTESEWQCT